MDIGGASAQIAYSVLPIQDLQRNQIATKSKRLESYGNWIFFIQLTHLIRVLFPQHTTTRPVVLSYGRGNISHEIGEWSGAHGVCRFQNALRLA